MQGHRTCPGKGCLVLSRSEEMSILERDFRGLCSGYSLCSACDLHPSASFFLSQTTQRRFHQPGPLASRARWLERMVRPSLTPASAVFLTVATSSTDTAPAVKSSMHGSSHHGSRNPTPALLQRTNSSQPHHPRLVP